MKICRKFIGFSIISLDNSQGYRTLNIFAGLFKIVKTDEVLKFYIFGLPVFSKQKKTILLEQIKNSEEKLYNKISCLESKMFEISANIGNIKSKVSYYDLSVQEQIKTFLSVQSLHSKIFPQFKDIHRERDIVIVGTGPTVINYVPIKDAIHISLNRAFKLNNINFDYLFMIDYTGVKTYIEDAQNYKCKKFYGRYLDHNLYNMGFNIPEYIVENANAYPFYVDIYPSKFNYDIENLPLMDNYSIAFPAINFALYTHPKRIYLVGCDCCGNGHYYNDNEVKVTGMPMNVEKIIDGYGRLKNFIAAYYPDIEIISINPVGLKGLFKDMNTLVNERI